MGRVGGPDELLMHPNDVRLSVCIQYVPWDSRRVKTKDMLVDYFDQFDDTTVSVVEGGEEEIRWKTTYRAWKRGLVGKSTHHLVLEDDVGLCNGFHREAKRAIAHLPDKQISFFSVYKVVMDAAKRNHSWCRIKGMGWGQARLLPREDIADMLEWGAKHVDPEYPSTDARLQYWSVYRKQEPVWCTVPSLVEHLGANDSTVGNDPPIRRTAAYFNPDPGLIDWTVPENPLTNRSKQLQTEYLRGDWKP